MKKLITGILFIVSLSTCKIINKAMDSYVGHTKQELYQSMGPPTRITSDGGGGEIIIYETYVRLQQTPGQVYGDDGQVTYTTPQNNGYTRSRMFYVNSKGIIYSWRWSGL